LHREGVVHVASGPASPLAQTGLLRNNPPQSHPLRSGWRDLLWALQRYETVVILCTDSREAVSGLTVFRILREETFIRAIIILSKLLYSDNIVLVGPGVTQVFPSMYGLFKPRHVRELTALVGAAMISLATTAVAIVVIVIQDALMRVRALR
jgi:hypothetical protein